MKILLHICCGPCASYPLPWLLEQGNEVCGCFYNPNIHPFTEHEKRREGAEILTRHYGVPLVGDEGYDPTPYLQAVAYREPQRCRFCHLIRLDQAARIAKKGKFDGFTTSLLASPYQKHDLVKEAGEMAANRYGVPFLYYDWRPDYSQTISRSRELGLYRQQYCGCLYSEWERFRKKGAGPA